MSDHRYPLHVRIIGILYKGNSKLYVASVLWSDQTDVIVYRSLRDFKQLHRQLKKKLENPFRPQDRVLPRFGGFLMKLNFQRMTPARCVQRVKALERYCTELLRCEPRISQSSDLIHFFIPKEEELQPEFAQNSIMVFQPEDAPNGQPRDLSSKRFSVGNVSQPYITKLYRCVAAYETKDTKNRPFSVKVDETLEVLIKDKAGWWLVENEEKRLAWFPAPYLQLCEDEEEGDDEFDSAGVALYCAVKNYTSTMKDELSLNIGAVVEVIQESDDGWWLVRYNKKEGYVPSIYLQPYTNPVFSMQKKLHSSNLNLSILSTVLSHPTHKSHFRKSQSMEVISELPCCSAPVPCNESNSHQSSLSDDTEFSSSVSLGLSLNGSEGDENLRESEKDAESDSPDSVLSMDCQSPTSSETSSPSKLCPQVPPRPQTQEILTRCTTYTRKAALETQARLFDRTEIKSMY
ncbi:NADPH oxidase organizer 1b [Hemibagrus wyckioides]|uniref:NADPH oxidase organizer 1b n=1 Tax=Hemibagrus wyckioides TaxID=337641 RepID=UPI00266D82CA|nr:NADPH oxidase organizer 1b [Hemibagrus wyckioides]